MPAFSSGNSLDSLAEAIEYRFRDDALLVQALTHRTYSHEHPDSAPEFNERLEFLGDAVLGMVISQELFARNADVDEGRLSKLKAALVRDATLARIAKTVGLGDHLRLGKGETQTGGRHELSRDGGGDAPGVGDYRPVRGCGWRRLAPGKPEMFRRSDEVPHAAELILDHLDGLPHLSLLDVHEEKLGFGHR